MGLELKTDWTELDALPTATRYQSDQPGQLLAHWLRIVLS